MVIFVIWGIIIYTIARSYKDYYEHEKSERNKRK